MNNMGIGISLISLLQIVLRVLTKKMSKMKGHVQGEEVTATPSPVFFSNVRRRGYS